VNRKGLAILLLILLLGPQVAAAGETAEQVIKRVGQAFAGFDDFWVWVTQRFRDEKGNEQQYRGRVYFKRKRMFRLNFGQPPFLVHGTDGTDYWVYKSEQKTIEVTPLGKDAPVHVLFQVFAAGDQMVRAFERFCDVDVFEETEYVDPKDGTKIPAYKLVVSIKPERLKELHEQAGENLLDKDAKQQWTFWVDKKSSLPRSIQVDWENKHRYIFELEKFYPNRGLKPGLFRRPTPPGVKIIEKGK